jgi:hypothetical protein
MYPFDEPREPLMIVPSAPGIHPRRSPCGVYDRALVCELCEAQFSPWDDYANRLLRKPAGEHDYTYVDGEPRIYTIPTYDYTNLKLFFVSLLWRASESDQSFCEHLNVGPTHTARLRQMILNGEPGEPEEYSVLLARLTHHDDTHKTVGARKGDVTNRSVSGGSSSSGTCATSKLINGLPVHHCADGLCGRTNRFASS